MRPQAAAKSLALYLDADPARAGVDRRRRHAAQADPVQPAVQCDQVLRPRQRRARPAKLQAGAARSACASSSPTPASAWTRDTQTRLFRRFAPGRSDAAPAPRRHRAGAGDFAQPGAPDGRRHHGATACPARAAASASSCRCSAATRRPAPAQRGYRPRGQRCARCDVLVAEDHPVNRQYLASLLETMQHHAHFVRQRPRGRAGPAAAPLRHRADGPAHARARRHRRHAWRSARCPTAPRPPCRSSRSPPTPSRRRANAACWPA